MSFLIFLRLLPLPSEPPLARYLALYCNYNITAMAKKTVESRINKRNPCGAVVSKKKENKKMSLSRANPKS